MDTIGTIFFVLPFTQLLRAGDKYSFDTVVLSGIQVPEKLETAPFVICIELKNKKILVILQEI